jgi:acetyl esterase/lipase
MRGSLLVIAICACSGVGAEVDGGVDTARDAGPLDATRPGYVPVARDCAVPPVPDPSEVELREDVVYATVGGAPLRLDLARPRDTAPRPLVIVVHGGGWVRGDKADARERETLLRLVGLGYVAASTNYRLVVDGDDTFPAAVEDVRCAIRWLVDDASALGVDPTRVVALGASAGGHLSLMASVAPDVGGLDATCASTTPLDLAGAVAFYGPTDLRAGRITNALGAALVETFLGASPDAAPERAALASPITHVDASDPPHLLVHGGLDTLVPPAQGRMLQAAFEAAGVPATYLELPAAPHAFDMITDDPAYRASTCTTLAYLARIFGA